MRSSAGLSNSCERHCILNLVSPIHILGGGLAGCEAAWQIARAGYDCVLFEMRPVRPTPAHKNGPAGGTGVQ